MTGTLRLYRLSPLYHWRIHAKGRCCAGGQGTIGCSRRATAAVFAGGPIRLATCAEHEQQLNEIGAWLASFGDPIPACILAEFMDRIMRAGSSGYAADFPLGGSTPPWVLKYCRPGTGCGHVIMTA
jgi:hypothetical protein